MSSDEALSELKKAKDKLDLGLITQEEFNSIKTELSKSDLFDARLQEKVLQIVDIAYGGSAGFNQAINLSMECLGNIRFIQEKKLVHQFFTEIQMDTGKACFMIGDTLKCLEMGAVETLILWEQFPDECKVIRNRETKEEKMILMTETVDDTNFETLDTIPFIDWISNNYKTLGIHIHAADGSISKDGPSGGVALTTLIYSLLNDFKIKQNIGITGEIDLDGNVCEIGGLDLKILGSLKSGINHFIFPKKNNKDYLNLIEKYKDNNKFENIIFSSVERIEEVFEIIFDK
jgi:hypothetical protein